jgi:hypothetical protein
MKLRNGLVWLAFLMIVVVIWMERRETRSELATVRAQLAAIAEASSGRSGAERLNPAAWPKVAPAEHAESDSPVADPVERPRRAAGQAPDERPAPLSRVEAFAKIHEAMDGAFEAESAEADWANHARYATLNKLGAALPADARIESVECRSSMCRIRTVHNSATSANAFINDKLMQDDDMPWAGPVSVGVVAEAPNGGPVTLVTYLGREGHQLPTVPTDDTP